MSAVLQGRSRSKFIYAANFTGTALSVVPNQVTPRHQAGTSREGLYNESTSNHDKGTDGHETDQFVNG